MKYFHILSVSIGLFMMSATGPAGALEASTTNVLKDFRWVDLSACKKPPRALPPALKENYRTYNIQRRYVDLDQDGTCEAMDVWIERLGENPSPGMRILDKRFFRFKGRKWQDAAIRIKFFPYAIRSVKTGKTVLIEAPSESDVSDNIVLGAQEIRTLVLSGWEEEPGSLDKLVLKPYEGQPGPVLQALAVFLTEQLVQQKASSGKKRSSNSAFDWSETDEREKILWIMQEANKTLSGSDRVRVDVHGLPVLPNK